MIVRLELLVVFIALVLFALGLEHMPQVPVTPQLVAGAYAFVSEDPENRATDHDLNRLVLRSDGTYELVEGGTTQALSKRKGTWRIVRGTPPNVLIDDKEGFPVETTRDEVRLLIDLDTGVWWAKRR